MQVQREQQQCQRAGPGLCVRSVVPSARGERTRTTRTGDYRKSPQNRQNIVWKFIEIDPQVYSLVFHVVCGLKIGRFRAVSWRRKCDPVFISQCCHRQCYLRQINQIEYNYLVWIGTWFWCLYTCYVPSVYHVYAADIFVIFNLRSCVRDFSQLCDRFVLHNSILYFGFWVLMFFRWFWRAMRGVAFTCSWTHESHSSNIPTMFWKKMSRF